MRELEAQRDDLLEAMEDLVSWDATDYDGDDIASMVHYGEAMDRARAAIAKARGQ